jgi:hypothetical protein
MLTMKYIQSYIMWTVSQSLILGSTEVSVSTFELQTMQSKALGSALELWTRSFCMPHHSTHTTCGWSSLPATCTFWHVCTHTRHPPGVSPSSVPPTMAPASSETLHTGRRDAVRPLKELALLFTWFRACIKLAAFIGPLLLYCPKYCFFFALAHHHGYVLGGRGTTSGPTSWSCWQEPWLSLVVSSPVATLREMRVDSHVTTSGSGLGWSGLIRPQKEIATSSLWMRALVKPST